MKKDEIVYCNLTVLRNKKKKVLPQVVYREKDGFYKGEKVLNVEVIKSLGFSNNSKKYTEVKKSNETRNTVTGSYD